MIFDVIFHSFWKRFWNDEKFTGKKKRCNPNPQKYTTTFSLFCCMFFILRNVSPINTSIGVVTCPNSKSVWTWSFNISTSNWCEIKIYFFLMHILKTRINEQCALSIDLYFGEVDEKKSILYKTMRRSWFCKRNTMVMFYNM